MSGKIIFLCGSPRRKKIASLCTAKYLAQFLDNDYEFVDVVGAKLSTECSSDHECCLGRIELQNPNHSTRRLWVQKPRASQNSHLLSLWGVKPLPVYALKTRMDLISLSSRRPCAQVCKVLRKSSRNGRYSIGVLRQSNIKNSGT